MADVITVIGYDGSPLTPEARGALDQATCVAGARRLLEAVPIPEAAHRIEVGNLDVALEKILGWHGPITVVASGDPGFFGIVRALRARGVRPRVLPAVSSVALAFARLGLPWDDALVLSAHGRDVDTVRAAAYAHAKVAILTAPGQAGPEHFAGPLLAEGREVHVAERLGTPGERVVRVRDPRAGEKFAYPNVVIAFDPGRAVASEPRWLAGHLGAPDGWALAEEHFDHRDNMITKAEVRALILARLGPGPGRTVWDVGAGSGSVAIECARFGAYAIAFERDPQACDRICANAARYGVHVHVVVGEAPESLEYAPAGADAVFVGGGTDEVVREAVALYLPRRVVVALASLDRVRPVRTLLVEHGYAVNGVQLQANRLAGFPSGSPRLSAANPVLVLWGERA